MRKEDKFIIIFILILGIFAVYDIGQKIFERENIQSLKATDNQTADNVSNDTLNNGKIDRINNNNENRLSIQGLRGYSRYTDNLKYDIQDNIKDRIPETLKNDLIVSFVIEEKGTINCCNILSSSGDNNIDKILTDSIKHLNPYKPLPKEHLGSGLMVKLTYGADNTQGFQSQPVYD